MGQGARQSGAGAGAGVGEEPGQGEARRGGTEPGKDGARRHGTGRDGAGAGQSSGEVESDMGNGREKRKSHEKTTTTEHWVISPFPGHFYSACHHFSPPALISNCRRISIQWN